MTAISAAQSLFLSLFHKRKNEGKRKKKLLTGKQLYDIIEKIVTRITVPRGKVEDFTWHGGKRSGSWKIKD